MAAEKDKYAPTTEGQRMDNPLARLIFSIIFVLLGLIAIIKIWAQYKQLLVPLLIVLTIGFILLTIWIKSLYIYRYLLPAMIIIMVFTAYPIVYTVYIAFTNFGTGHMQTKNDAKDIILNKLWDGNPSIDPLYAEFYGPKLPIIDYLTSYEEQFKEYKKSIELKKQTKKDGTEEGDFDSTQEAQMLIKTYLDPIKLTDIKILLYSKKSITDVNDIGDLKVYLYEFEKENEKIVEKLSEIKFEEIEKKINKDYYIMLSDGEVYKRSGMEIAYKDLEEITTFASSQNVKVLANWLKDNNTSIRKVIKIVDKTNNKENQYVWEQSNQFYSAVASFKKDEKNQIWKNDGTGNYTRKVFENNKNGAFVLTKDEKPPVFWKEYDISKPEFDYGFFTLEKNSTIEDFLNEKIADENLELTFSSDSLEKITGIKKEDVNKEDLKKVKEEIAKANKMIYEFNEKIKKKYKEEFIKLEESKYKLNKDLTEKEKKRLINMLYKYKFPKLSYFQIIEKEVSNIDNSIKIEPGYFVTVGFANFSQIFTSRNITSPFFRVFIWTVVWSAVSVISSFAMGLALALIFNQSDFKGKYIYRTLFILPYAIPGFVSILMWQGFFNEDFGVINKFFNIHVPWITSSGTMAKVSVLIVNLWLSFPYFMIICLGALQSIDMSMYEAADVDGATQFQQFKLITLPLLLMALGPMLVGSFAFAFNNFAGIYLLTSGGPVMAPGVLPGHTDILISYTYKLAFGEQDKNYGLASAIAIIVFFIIGTITFLNFKFTGTFKEVDNA